MTCKAKFWYRKHFPDSAKILFSSGRGFHEMKGDLILSNLTITILEADDYAGQCSGHCRAPVARSKLDYIRCSTWLRWSLVSEE